MVVRKSEDGVGAELGEGVLRRDQPLEVVARGLHARARAGEREDPVRRVAAPQRDGAPADPLDPELGAVGRPAVEGRAEALGVAAQPLVPLGRVRERVLGGVAEQDRVAADAVDPAPQRRRPVLVRAVSPADEQVREAARREMGGDAADELGAEGVPGQTVVAEREGRVRRDQVRRIGDDQVEGLALDRGEPVAAPPLDALAAVQHGVQLREGERARVHVDADDPPRVCRGQDREDAAARAEVERRADLAADREARERAGRRGQAEDLVTVLGEAPALEAIGRDEQLLGRDEVDEGPRPGAVELEEAGRGETVERRGRERLGGVGGRHLRAEVEEGDECREPLAGRQEPQLER